MTPFITKEQFVSVLDALQEQYYFDKKNADVLGMMFGCEIGGAYNNSVITKAMLDLLRNYFLKDEEGHCEIEHWAYVLEFGKHGEEYEDAGQLYYRLLKDKAATLCDDEKMWFATPKGLLWAPTGLVKGKHKILDDAPECAFLPERPSDLDMLRYYNPDTAKEFVENPTTIKDENP